MTLLRRKIKFDPIKKKSTKESSHFLKLQNSDQFVGTHMNLASLKHSLLRV
jgi:hypothetical protein